ncbi:MAG: type 1 glutamine amidotransferase [Actinobacteria bacterium]|nr:type 1 glutamine amidotransferase [Actinomycetota bacterium]
MKALFIQHDHVSPTGWVGEALTRHGFELTEVLVVPEAQFETPNVPFEFPDFNDFDLLVPLGAPWGAWDDACIGNWLTPELDWVKSAIEADKPVLGICFGGQLMARALGGSVAPGPKGEIGWTAIWSERQDLLSNGPWFQFHYDRWQLPPGAIEIARNPIASQAFWGGLRSVGEDGQDPEIMMQQTIAEDPASRERTFHLIDNYLSKVAKLI